MKYVSVFLLSLFFASAQADTLEDIDKGSSGNLQQKQSQEEEIVDPLDYTQETNISVDELQQRQEEEDLPKLRESEPEPREEIEY